MTGHATPLAIGDLTLATPLLNASGAFDVDAADPDWRASLEPARHLGAYVTKTVTRSPRAGNPQPWVALAGSHLPDSLVNSVGLANPGIDAVLAAGGGRAAAIGVPVVLSVGGPERELGELVAHVEHAAPPWVAAIELNLSCPNDRTCRTPQAADAELVARLVRAARAATRLPLIAKLTAACADPGEAAAAAEAEGADAISAANTLPVRAVGDDGAQLLGTVDGGLSGRALHQVALRCVARIAEVVDVPVIGIGGVDGPAAAQRMLDAGACAIGVGTAAALDPSVLATLALHLAGAGREHTPTAMGGQAATAALAAR